MRLHVPWCNSRYVHKMLQTAPPCKRSLWHCCCTLHPQKQHVCYYALFPVRRAVSHHSRCSRQPRATAPRKYRALWCFMVLLCRWFSWRLEVAVEGVAPHHFALSLFPRKLFLTIFLRQQHSSSSSSSVAQNSGTFLATPSTPTHPTYAQQADDSRTGAS